MPAARSKGPRRVASLASIEAEIVRCRACPRLVEWREGVAHHKRRAYRDDAYWGRPVPGFGDPAASLVIVGLAPGAHGANRTGRMFTGDGSGDFLYAALHRAGLASQAESTRRDDGLALRGVFITAAARCAPPDNRPTPAELAACRPFLARDLVALEGARVYLALGAIAYQAVTVLARAADPTRSPPPPFSHGADLAIADPRGGRGDARLVASYHVSRQNTQTGRLTSSMFDAVLGVAVSRAGLT
jgi:uracil-DNA glycosylase family 4